MAIAQTCTLEYPGVLPAGLMEISGQESCFTARRQMCTWSPGATPGATSDVSGQVSQTQTSTPAQCSGIRRASKKRAFANVFPQLVEASGKRGTHTCTYVYRWEKSSYGCRVHVWPVVSALYNYMTL